MTENKTACFTGHRIIARGEVSMLKAKLVGAIDSLVNQGYRTYISGGALGWDMLAAAAVLELKDRYPDISLIMMLPCYDQEKGWSERDKAVYKNILAKADELIYVSMTYSNDCMKKRNMQMIKMSDFCIAYVKHQRSGASQTMRLAKEKGIGIINLSQDT